MINKSTYIKLAEKSIKPAINYLIKNNFKVDSLVYCAYPRTKNWGQSIENVKY